MKKNYLVLSLFVIGVAFLILPLAAKSAIVPCDQCGLCDFFLLIKNIFNFIAFKLTPPVGGFLILLAGFLFLIAGGSEEKVSQAKKVFINAFIGVLIVYCSWLIVNTLIGVMAKDVEGFSAKNWYTFTCNAK